MLERTVSRLGVNIACPGTPTQSLGTPAGVFISGEWGVIGGRAPVSHCPECKARKSLQCPLKFQIYSFYKGEFCLLHLGQ